MDLSLILAAFMLGLAGMPHCAAMCGAPCAAVVGRGAATERRAASLGFHAARVAGYALAGGLAAAGVSVLAMAGSAAPLVRPLWTLLHMAALALGLWLLITGRQPAFMTRLGRAREPQLAAAGGWRAVNTPWTAAAAGSVWVAWPCGLLQSALVVAALSNTPQAGAAAMAAFALASAGGLQAAPYLAGRLDRLGAQVAVWAVRLAGLALAIGSGWALGHDMWARVAAYCAT
jgi:sulfite exporter TauE/SafE